MRVTVLSTLFLLFVSTGWAAENLDSACMAEANKYDNQYIKNEIHAECMDICSYAQTSDEIKACVSSTDFVRKETIAPPRNLPDQVSVGPKINNPSDLPEQVSMSGTCGIIGKQSNLPADKMKEFYVQCEQSCKNHKSIPVAMKCGEEVLKAVASAPAPKPISKEASKPMPRSKTFAPSFNSSEACKEVAHPELRQKCMSWCSRQGSTQANKNCAKKYAYEYTWVDDAETRKLLSGNTCGNAQICIGQVKYKDENGHEVKRLAVCGSENCDDGDAGYCALQGGYSSKVASEVYKDQRPSAKPEVKPAGVPVEEEETAPVLIDSIQ